MKSDRLASSAVLYTFTNIATAIIPYLLVAVLTRLISQSDYGLFAGYQVVFLLLGVLVGVNGHAAIALVYNSPDEFELPVYVFNVMLLEMITFLVLLLVGVMITLLGGGAHFQIPVMWVLAALLAATFQFLISIQLTLWQMGNCPIAYGSFQIIQNISYIIITIFLVVFGKRQGSGCVISHLAAYVIFGCLALFFMLKRGSIRAKLSVFYIKHILKIGWPLVPHNVGTWGITMVGRLILLKMVGAAEMGVYSFAAQFGMGIAVLQNSFNQAFVPWLFKRLKEPSEALHLLLVRITYGYMGALTLIALVISLMSPLIIRIFGTHSYVHGAKYIPWIAFAFVMNGVYKMICNYIFYSGKTYFLSISTGFAALTSLALTYFFVKRYGTVGAAYATFLSFALSSLLSWLFAQRLYPLPWRKGFLSMLKTRG